MNDNDFMRRQREAVEQMREMNSRAVPSGAGHSMPPVPPFVKVQGNRQNRSNSSQPSRQQATTQTAQGYSENTPAQTSPPRTEPMSQSKNSGLLGGLDLPFLDMLTKESDVSLIIGLLLILMSEKADKKLLFALVYILM
ncbi:MAG: hypothetical protein ACI4FN_05370 [Acutalibacteraceae bacterium]